MEKMVLPASICPANHRVIAGVWPRSLSSERAKSQCNTRLVSGPVPLAAPEGCVFILCVCVPIFSHKRLPCSASQGC